MATQRRNFSVHRYLSILGIEEIFRKKKPLHRFIALHGLSDGDGVVVEIGDVRVDGHAIARFQKFLSKDLLFIEKEYAIVQSAERAVDMGIYDEEKRL